MTEPIKPNDVLLISKPDQIIEVFNKLIIENWDGGQAIVKQKEAAERIAKRVNITSKDVYEKKYLDIEESYKQKGWRVTYNKPGYNEHPYDPYFCFSKKETDE